MVLTANKGVAMVVMEKQDYKDRALSLLSDTNTYRDINKDPTTMLRNQLINTLKDIKQTGGGNDSIYKKVYLTTTVPPSFMASPNPEGWHPSQIHCVQQVFHYLWCGQGSGRYHLPLGRSIPTLSNKYSTFGTR